MKSTTGNEGINKLAGVIQSRIKKIAETPSVMDIGQINRDMSLTVNQFPQPIPESDYLVCRQLTLDAELSTGFSKKNIRSEKTRGLQPGDRVLVAWVGNDACVIGTIG